jgi:hypothetical protein
MRSLSLIGLLALVSAYPQAPPSAPKYDPADLSNFNTLTTLIGFLATLDLNNTVKNDLTDGSCKTVLLIIARGSLEPGNIVRTGHIV